MTFVGFAAMGIIESPLLEKGDPSRLTHGFDYKGNICGITNYTTPTGANIIDLPMSYVLSSGISVCVDECPAASDLNQFHCKYEIEALIKEQLETLESNTTAHASYLYYSSTKQCMPHIATRAYLGYCLPNVIGQVISEQLQKEYANNNVTSSSNFTIAEDEGGNFFDQTMADFYLARHVILVFGIGCAVILGFVFLMLMRVPALLPVMVWSLILGISAGLGFGGYMLHETSNRWATEQLKEPRQIKALYWISIVSYCCSGLWLMIICAIRKRIVLAIACVKEASFAISRMPLIVLYPCLQVLAFVAYLIPWGIFMVYLASSGEMRAQCMCLSDTGTPLSDPTQNAANTLECEDGCFQYKVFEYSKETKYAGLYMIFSLFWTSQFIIAVGEVSVSLAISMWYFSRNKNSVSNATLFKAIGLASFYHLGTCAFGSLIIGKGVFVYIEVSVLFSFTQLH